MELKAPSLNLCTTGIDGTLSSVCFIIMCFLGNKCLLSVTSILFYFILLHFLLLESHKLLLVFCHCGDGER